MQGLSLQNALRGGRHLVAFFAALPLLLPGIFQCSCCSAIDILPCSPSINQQTSCCSADTSPVESCCLDDAQSTSKTTEQSPDCGSEAGDSCSVGNASSLCSSESAIAKLGVKKCKCCKEASSRSLLATFSQVTFAGFLPELNSVALVALPSKPEASTQRTSIHNASGKQKCVEQCRWLN